MRTPTCQPEVCELCQASLRFDRPFACVRADCPVKPPAPLIRRAWFLMSAAVMIVIVASVFSFFWVQARNLTRVPRVLKMQVQDTTWRGKPWQAHVEAEGFGSLSFQWYKGFPGDTSEPLPQATMGTLKIGNLQEEARYWLRISNLYGTVQSEGIVVTPRSADTADLDREVDELLFFARAVLEQTDNLAIYERQLQAIDEIDPKQREIFQGLTQVSLTKQGNALEKLAEKLGYLRANADPEAINVLFDARRPASGPTEQIDDERIRKTFSLAEGAWRAARDGRPLSRFQIIDHASAVLPF